MQLLIDGADVVDGDGNPIDLSLPEADLDTDTPGAPPEEAAAAAAEEEHEA